MNIKEAKQEVINTVRAYTLKDGNGHYRIPFIHQRPILLIGPPGIGKTAIMEQVARECDLALVSYTMTHHTRQSAIGLPVIETRSLDGQTFSVTEYTMSEILASVYETIEREGKKEGILFLDEINCVSETLAPSMLQFLQSKIFGTHHLPQGWIIASAGNPPQYNKSVKELDIATLDRVKKITVQEDLTVWNEYAVCAQVHPAILSYLNLNPKHFYSIQTSRTEKSFVTARGWEDLSRILTVYEELEIPAGEELILQYIQQPTIARDFANYLTLFASYQKIYPLENILVQDQTDLPPATIERLKTAPMNERISLIHALAHKLEEHAEHWYTQSHLLEHFSDVLTKMEHTDSAAAQADAVCCLLAAEINHQKHILTVKRDQSLFASGEEAELEQLIRWLEQSMITVKAKAIGSAADAFAFMKTDLVHQSTKVEILLQAFSDELWRGLNFTIHSFGHGCELFLLLSDLSFHPAVTQLTAKYTQLRGCLLYQSCRNSLDPVQQQKTLAQDIRQYLQTISE